VAAIINQWAVVTIVLSGIALVCGVVFIRRGHREAHLRAMATASALATLFLVLYLTRLGLGYEKRYVGPEAWRGAYFALLISHIILAAVNLPLALGALWNAVRGLRAAGHLGNIDAPAARGFFNRHRAWVRWTVPVWLYVAVTGWVIYLVLGRYGEVVKG
jgi:putative membrane protein